MAVRLTEADIAALLSESKPLPADYRRLLETRAKRGHKERELPLEGATGNGFRLIIRQSNINPLDFSVILTYQIPSSNQSFRLRRYNGRSHQHSNKLERQTFYDFHIHTATERYQERDGFDEDGYAEPTERYATLDAALQCMINDCGFQPPVEANPQLPLFS